MLKNYFKIISNKYSAFNIITSIIYSLKYFCEVILFVISTTMQIRYYTVMFSVH